MEGSPAGPTPGGDFSLVSSGDVASLEPSLLEPCVLGVPSECCSSPTTADGEASMETSCSSAVRYSSIEPLT